MSSPAVQQPLSTVRCEECRAAVQTGGRQSLSFLLLEGLTIPVLGCADHLEQFASVCGYTSTSEDAAELLGHRPAGGVSCPGCRLAPHQSSHPVVQVEGGAVVPLACPDHQSELVQRFRTGLQTQHQLSSTLGSPGRSSR